MKTIRIALVFALLLSFAIDTVVAQNPAIVADPSAPVPAVTASVSASDSVRFTSPGEILQIRLEVYSSNGEMVFDSGSRQGNVIDWKIADASQTLTDGQFL